MCILQEALKGGRCLDLEDWTLFSNLSRSSMLLEELGALTEEFEKKFVVVGGGDDDE